MSRAFTIGSLFSGIGGLELGLERSIPGAHTIWQVEQDTYARGVLEKHWPHARRFEDVKEVGAHNLQRPDLICGGFPCQDISTAGRREGIEGERSVLLWEYERIICEVVPRFVVVENVAALTVRGLDVVLGSLAALGYNAVWDCIPAESVGAHHRRDRLFIVAWTVSNADEREVWNRSEWQERQWHDLQGQRIAEPRYNGDTGQMANAIGERLQGHRQTRGAGQICPQEAARLFSRSLKSASAWEPESNVGRVANGVPNRMDRLKCLGNAVVPQVAEVIGRVVVELLNAK